MLYIMEQQKFAWPTFSDTAWFQLFWLLAACDS